MMIRPARESDAAALLAIYAPFVEHTAYSFEYEVPSEAEFRRRIRETTAQFPWLVCEEDGELLGYAYGSPAFSRRAYGFLCELSVYLGEGARHKGLGRRLYGLCEEILRRQGYCRIYCVVTSENEASCRFHEALGYRNMTVFQNSGLKFGRWYSTVWYEKVLSEAVPAEFPRPWRELRLDDLLPEKN